MRTVILYRENVHKGYQILVNREHPLEKNCLNDFMRLIPIDTEHMEVLLETKTTALLSQLLQAIGCSNEIIPVSGYRDRAEQEKIYGDSLLENGRSFTEQYVALPDRSEHQTGLAIDLSINSDEIDYIRPDFPYTGICGDFRSKAAKYGFIERYEKGKEAITGIAHEPWHFRYVGYPHAQIMQDNHLSFEEYISFIKNFPYDPCKRKHYYINEITEEIEVFYVSANSETTAIELSEKCCFQISGNNVDGFIVTVWRR